MAWDWIVNLIILENGDFNRLKKGYFKNINKLKNIGHIEVDEIGSLQISSNKSWQLAKILSKNIKYFEDSRMNRHY